VNKRSSSRGEAIFDHHTNREIARLLQLSPRPFAIMSSIFTICSGDRDPGLVADNARESRGR
jgi:hypothetical protein